MTAGLYALMKAQVRRLVVEENTDLSPLRQRNVQRRHYERNLASVKPPLPPDIMEELRRKTLGIHVPIPAVFFDPLASGKTIPVVNELDKRGMSEEALANMQHTKKGRKR
jgi:hypothetical protein